MTAAHRKPEVAPRLFDWLIAASDADGRLEMSTRTMAQALSIGSSTVEHLMARWKPLGAVRVVRRGGPYGPSIWMIDAALRDEAAACAAVHPSHIGRHRSGGGPAVYVSTIDPPMRETAPVSTRCPRCELPPGHALCAHGWDGVMTRMQRRDAQAAAAHELRRAS
ncbi:hypothetical protein V6U71_21595 [Sphingopyxis sp. J-6]|uniref:hypothetical protein n=1 Tax=Sphingopyxis sp. J-6 TaxID=3122054 RepID=UPI0039844735